MAEDYEKTYADFWKSIVENPDGTLNLDQVMRELHDYHQMIEQVPLVYSEVTGGRISKPNTMASAVIGEAIDVAEGDLRDLAREISKQILAEASGEGGVRCPCHEDAARIALRVAGIEDDTAAAESAKADR